MTARANIYLPYAQPCRLWPLDSCRFAGIFHEPGWRRTLLALRFRSSRLDVLPDLIYLQIIGLTRWDATVPNYLVWLEPNSARFVVRGLKARFRDQKVEFALIRRHVRSGDIVCDIGANKGSFVFWLSRWCRKGTVVAFEPQPPLARSLAAICSRLRLNNVKVEAKAVYSRSGNIELFVPKGHSPGASLIGKFRTMNDYQSVSVPMVSLDDYFDRDQRISLLKIDVEGAELEVFKGAERILREQSPLLVFECENRHLEAGSVQDVFSYLTSFGYEGSFIYRNRLLPLSSFDPLVHQRQDGEWFWKKADYCNNFVFAKSSPFPKP